MASILHDFVAIALLSLDTSSFDTGLNDDFLGMSLFGGKYLS